MGDFNVTLIKKPRYIIEDICTGCNTCVRYCPIQVPDPYNQDLSNNKAIHIYFEQAVPLVTYVDPDACIYLTEDKCLICQGVCENKAIDFTQKPEKVEINVGAIVLASGFEPFDPSLRRDYGYGVYENVVTSLDFERLTCSTGPHRGEVLRPSDLKHPKKIAWIQCVGSRQVVEGGNTYCSAVCCTYTQKQAALMKVHDEDAECTIFHNDVRAYGKDFERYYQRTAELPGVRFIRSYVSVGREDPETKNVTIRYATPDEGVKEEEFDLVVLSVGLTPPKEAEALAEKFGIRLNDHRFCETDPALPIRSTRPGIFISGAFQGPIDIPESVFTASGASSLAGELLKKRRGKLTIEKVYPTERDVAEEEPRIGVFVCRCGANIGSVVNVPDVVEYCKTLPYVVYAQEQLFSCATNAAQEITDVIKDNKLNRVVIAACSPLTLEPLFRDTVREAGLNQYFLEMANIREHDSWVHSKEKEEATEKAKDIIRMSVARATHLEPLQEIELPVNKNAVVVGGGVAGMNCALSIANQGHDVYLIEKEPDLGGMARKLYHTLEGMDVQAYLEELKEKVYRHPLIHVLTGATITEVSGYIGNFVTAVDSGGWVRKIDHGATVIAIGADEYVPTEYLYGENDQVLTYLEMEEKIAKGDEALANAENVVMIQCVGCRNEDRNYCSRVCCSHAVKNALNLKKANPQADSYILYRDMRTYGFKEDYYRQASENDIKFVRYEPDKVPTVQAVEEGGKKVLRVGVYDPILGKEIAVDADILGLAAAVVPSSESQKVANLYKVPLGPDGFFKEAHVKLRPVDFATDGVFLCGTAHYPKHIEEAINQAYGAAGRVLTLLSHDIVTVSGAVCVVDEKRCMGCGACATACTYGAIKLQGKLKRKKAEVNPVLCKGCGLCNAVCPTAAISLKHYNNEEIVSEIDAALSKII